MHGPFTDAWGRAYRIAVLTSASHPAVCRSNAVGEGAAALRVAALRWGEGGEREACGLTRPADVIFGCDLVSTTTSSSFCSHPPTTTYLHLN